MDLPGGSVGDKPQVPGVRVQGQGALVFPGESDLISVADGDDGAQLIGAEDGAVRVVQPGQRCIVGMGIGVSGAYGDYRVFRHGFVEETVAGGGAAAVVTHFQHICGLPFLAPVVQHVNFCEDLHIPGEKEGSLQKIHPDNDGCVVGFRIGFHRAQNGNLGISQGEAVAGGGDLYRFILLVGIAEKIVKAGGCVGYGGGKDPFRRESCQHTGQSAHMILMGVGADHPGQGFHALIQKIGNHQLTVVHVAAVDEHKLPAAFQKGAVCLTHVQKMNRERGSIRLGGGRIRFEDDGHLAAAQHQTQGEDQNDKPLHFVVSPLLFLGFFC